MQTITLKIGSASSGRDFVTVPAAHASTPSDWVAADVAYVYELYNDSEFVETSVWSLGGKVMDATHNLVVRPAAGHSFKDNANILTNALRYNQANGVAVKFALNYAQHIGMFDYVTVEGLQIKSSGNGAIVSIAGSGTVGTGKASNCLIEFAGSSAQAKAVQLKAGKLWNTHIILTGATSTGVYYLSGGVTPSVESVTVTRLTSLAAATKPAFDSDVAGFKITNCAAFGCSVFSTRSDYVGSNNASDGNILFGTNNKTNLVYANQFVDTVNDFRVKSSSSLIDAGTTPNTSNILTINGVRQQGVSADIGAWENPSAIQAPIATVTGISVTNQNVVITGTTTGNPTSGTASLAVTSIPYNSGVAQGPVSLALSNGAFTATFNNVSAGRYDLAFFVANANYTAQGINSLGSIDVVGPRALSLIQDDVTGDQVLTIHGTCEKATSGSLVISAPSGGGSVPSQTVSVTINTTATPNTFTASAALAPGNYSAPILTFTGSGGTSLPQSGTSSVIVVGPRALTVVQDPIDGQMLVIHGTVEKATSGRLVVPVSTTNPNGAIEQNAAVTVDTSVTPNTFTVSVPLPPGNYNAPLLMFSNAIGESQLQAGTSAVSIMSIDGSPQAPMPTGEVVSDTTPPTMVGTLSVSGITTTGFTVSWQAATDDFGVAYYEVSTDGVNYSSVGNVLTYTTSSANPSTTYNVKVRAVDTSANKATPLNTTVTTLTASDTSTPVMTGAITSSNINSSGFVILWLDASDNISVAGYEYSLNNGAYVDVGTSLTVTFGGLSANTSYYIQVRAYDAAGNRSSAIATTVKTANYTPFSGFTPSVSRTINVQATSPVFTGGKWWTFTDPKKPRGLKDPDAIIDITFDWTAWLDDIGSATISDVTFTLNGLSSVGTFSDGNKTTVFVSGGTAGSSAAVSCLIKTFTNPARTEQRTVYIDIADE